MMITMMMDDNDGNNDDLRSLQ